MAITVAFVCLGNICRSPMAEAVFADMVNKHNLSDQITDIQSFGTAGYHIGETPDSRTVQTCKEHGVPINHRAQQITPKDFENFDYVLCMDNSNLKNLHKIQPKGNKSKVAKFGEWKDRESGYDAIIDDPYYGGKDGFEICYKQCVHFSEQFIEKELDIKL